MNLINEISSAARCLSASVHGNSYACCIHGVVLINIHI